MNQSMLRYAWLAAICCSLLYACLPPEDKPLVDVHVSLRDSMYQQLHNMQDRSELDSLYSYLRHPNPTYRYISALALASIRDSAAVDSLHPLLQDPVPTVRQAAAFAAGQIGSPRSEPVLLSAFVAEDTAGDYRHLNGAILEAIGKVGTADKLRSMSTVTTYLPSDTALLLGQVRGIYRFGLRGITLPEGTARMVALASNHQYPSSVRLMAAHYLARVSGIDLSPFTSKLVTAVESENLPELRMPLVIALGKSTAPEALAELQQRLSRDPDYRVRSNILRALGNFDYDLTKAFAYQALSDDNLHVAQRAAQFFLDYGDPKDATLYWRWAKDSLAWPVQTTLYKAANHHLPIYYQDYRNAINAELRSRFAKANDPYEKADALSALAEFGWNYQYVQREALIHPSPAVRTAGIRALNGIARLENFDNLFGASRRRVSGELAAHFVAAIRSGDVGLVAEAAEALENPQRPFRELLADSIGVLQQTLRRLDAPQHIEVRNRLARTIDYLRGYRPRTPSRPEYNHPIDWSLLNSLDTTGVKMVMETVKGTVNLELWPTTAPGAVANFVALSEAGFYDGLAFHRVVPNFVVQGGCPRGDGYGGPEHTIRSELMPRYFDGEGMLGMADAGPHTAGSQFFITHSPTPHLDGNFTIFGRVTEGMEIIHRLQIGDEITKVRLAQPTL